MTNKNAVSELTKMEKAQATLHFDPRTSADAIGDLDRTSDGFANTQRRLKAELRETATQMGEALMPTVAMSFFQLFLIWQKKFFQCLLRSFKMVSKLFENLMINLVNRSWKD